MINSRKLFTLFLLICSASFVVLALQYSPEGRLVPLLIGVPTLALVIYQTLLDFVPAMKKFQKGKVDMFGIDRVHEEHGTEESEFDDVAEDEARRRFRRIVLWILGFTAIVYILGVLVSIAVFCFMFFLAHKEKLWFNLVLTGATWLSIWGLFVKLLEVPFYQGILFKMLAG